MGEEKTEGKCEWAEWPELGIWMATNCRHVSLAGSLIDATGWWLMM